MPPVHRALQHGTVDIDVRLIQEIEGLTQIDDAPEPSVVASLWARAQALRDAGLDPEHDDDLCDDVRDALDGCWLSLSETHVVQRVRGWHRARRGQVTADAWWLAAAYNVFDGLTGGSGGGPGLRPGRNPVRCRVLPVFYVYYVYLAGVRTAYRCRAYPDAAQAGVLNRTFGCVRLVWNRTLAERQRLYRAEGRSLSYAASDAALTALKKDPDLAFLSEVSSVPLQQALRHQHQAFSAFFAKRARYPRFKSRRSRQSASYTRSAFTMRDGELRLAKTERPLEFTWSWPDVDVTVLNPSMVTVCRELDGRWYVTFAVDAAAPEPLEETGRAVGVDLGIKDFAVTSDGEKIANPRHLERKARNLARYQKRLARCQKGLNNRAKARAKVARAHRKVRDARKDFLHKTSTRLVRENDRIVIEDLAVANMVLNRSLARAISDCGWGEFRRQLAYKCDRHGRELVVIDRWFPSSKTCSACGHLLAELSLSARHWTCPSCGTRHDRDLNAAKNILAAGQAVARGSPGDACGAGVRHSGSSRVQPAVKQEPRPARAGIPALQGGK